MKTLAISMFTILSFPLLANGLLVDEDPIMRESLSRQGAPAPSLKSQQQQELQDQEELRELKQRVNRLQEQVENLKETQQQRIRESEKEKVKNIAEKQVERVSVEHGLRNAEKRGVIGRYAIMEGTTTALAYKKGETPQRREVPGLQVCATLADLNKLTKEDLEFMGFDSPMAQKIVQARKLMGQFKTSKQLKAVEGIDPEAYKKVQDSIIAIEEQRLAE